MKRIKFNKQVTVEFWDESDTISTDKTFYHNQIVEVEDVDDSIHGFVDLMFENGDIAVGIPKQGLTFLE